MSKLEYHHTTLHYHRILLVAVANPETKLWCVYIGTVPGIDHEKEWELVWRHGNLMPLNEVKVLWPRMTKMYEDFIYSEDI